MNCIAEEAGVYCAQDLRELIGFKIVEVESNDIDILQYITVENEETGELKKLTIDDVMFDGERMHILPYDTNIVDITTHDATTEELQLLQGYKVYSVGKIWNASDNEVGTSITYAKSNGKKQQLISLHIYNNGTMKISDKY